MCRVFGCVAAEPASIRHELLDAENPMIRQSEEHDSGWGLAVYERADGSEPKLIRCPEAAYMGGDYVNATSARGRIFNVHVRRATMGGLTLDNTHPFCLGNYSFGHNGTVLHWPRLLEPGVAEPAGETDSEALFNLLMRDYDPAEPLASLRATVTAVVERSPFSGVNFLFTDGERLYAYRFGLFDLHWLAPPGPIARVIGEADERALAHRPAGRDRGYRPRRPRRAACRASPGRRFGRTGRAGPAGAASRAAWSHARRIRGGTSRSDHGREG